MPFLFEKKTDKKDGHEYIEIAGYEGSITKLVIPDQLEGLPVEAIGNHSFSGRSDIESVVIPDTVRTIYGFAFHDCRNLQKISLFDSIDDYYDGVCRQCDRLTDIDITIKRNWYEVIRNFLADNDKTLRFSVHDEGGDSCLTFPEYVYGFEENTMARTIQFTIDGSGYAYRECVDRRSINYREYDKLFGMAVIDGDAISEDVAIGRILYPRELDDAGKIQYEGYIRKNAGSILDRYIPLAKEDSEIIELIRKLVSYTDSSGEYLFSKEVMDRAIKTATDRHMTVLGAVLMDARSQDETGDLEFMF